MKTNRFIPEDMNVDGIFSCKLSAASLSNQNEGAAESVKTERII